MTAPNGDVFQFFGNQAPPAGLRGGWHQVQANDCWGATPGTPDYNMLVSRPDAACNNPDEYLPNLPTTYSQAALIDANMGPNRSGDQPGEAPLAAAIFLHRHTYARRRSPRRRRAACRSTPRTWRGSCPSSSPARPGS